jgi:AcrR family transcriptional regulator
MSDQPARSRDAAATRDAIFESAKQAFSEGGADVGVRDIAARAGVNSSLINRYFGSKDQLLSEVVCSVPLDFAAVLKHDRAHFGVNVARGLIASCQKTGDFDPTLVMLRSLGSPGATTTFSTLIDTWLDPLADVLDGADCRLRAELILSAMAGFQIFGRVVSTRGIAEAAEEKVIALLGATIQSYVDAPLP